MLKNIFYSAKKNLFKYVALPVLAIMASCSLNKEFAEDDLYYSPKDDFTKTEIVSNDSIQNKYKKDTLEIETIQDLNYAVSQGADATFYWENYFMYSPYSSSLGWDYDGDGIVNAFDLHPYSSDFFDDINNNGISDALEFGHYSFSNSDFIYWDLQWNHHRNYSYWNNPWHNHTNIYYFEYGKDWIKPLPRRRRNLATKVLTQTQDREDTGVRRSDPINSKIIREKRTRPKTITSTRQRYERSRTQERPNTNYNPRTNINIKTRNTYTPRTNTRSRTSTTRQNTSTRSSGSTVRSSSGSSRSSGTSTRSSGSSSGSSKSGSSSSSSSRRGGRR